jgi:hypothetical protein
LSQTSVLLDFFFPFPIAVLKANKVTSSATSSPIYFTQLFIFKHLTQESFYFSLFSSKAPFKFISIFSSILMQEATSPFIHTCCLSSLDSSNSSWSSFTQKSYVTFILSFLSIKLFHLQAMSMLSHKKQLSHWLMIVKNFIRSYHGCWKHRQNLLRYSRDRLSRNQARNKACWKTETETKTGRECVIETVGRNRDREQLRTKQKERKGCVMWQM